MTVRYGIPAVVLAVVAAAGCGTSTDTTAAAPTNAVEVRVARVESQPIANTFEAGGVVRARMTAQMNSRIVADVRDVTVRAGDRVRRGQIVATLDGRELAARRAQAQASLAAAGNARASADAERESAAARLALARATHARIEVLRASNSATPHEMDRAVSDVRVAESALRAAESRRDEAQAAIAAAEAADRAAEIAASFAAITAPFDGVVTARLIEPGNLASPGVPLVSIETTDSYRLEVQIDEVRARSLSVGDPVALDLGAAGEGDPLIGRIIEIAQAIDPTTHAFVVKVQIPAGLVVRSGTFARATFTTGQRPAVMVPKSSVTRRGQLSTVFTVDAGGRAAMRAIRAGAESKDGIEVLAGLRPGDQVVIDPPPSLTDGAAVRVTGVQP